MGFVDTIANAMYNSLGAPLTVLLLSIIPIAEAKFAIPFGVKMGLSQGESFGWALLGSSAIVPILLLVLIPIIKALAKTKLFSKLGKFLYDRFDKKSKSIKTEQSADSPTQKKRLLTKSDWKRMGSAALFVAVPAPLTGVWTGSAVATITNLGFVKGLISVIVGNTVACGIVTAITYLPGKYTLDIIIYVFAAIFVIIIIVFIIKLIMYKPDKDKARQIGEGTRLSVKNAADKNETDESDKSSIDCNTTDKTGGKE